MLNSRFATLFAASGAVITTFALGMAPMVAHAADASDVAAPVEHVQIDDNGVPSLRVSYAGLDLNDAADRQEMDRRIRRAASSVCEPLRVNLTQSDYSIAYQNCRRDAIAQGRAGIDGLNH